MLTDDLFSQRSHAAIQARIYGLGNIRSEKAVQGIYDLMGKVGYRKLDPYMRDIRLALVRLTGEDNGPSVQLWLDWWQDNKKTFRVAPEAKFADEDDARRWNKYWGIEKREKKTG